jgi:hypothetical protein
LHAHLIDNCSYVSDGHEPEKVPDGFEVAPGDKVDMEVCGAHAWQSSWLAFADGQVCGTAICNRAQYVGKSLIIVLPAFEFVNDKHLPPLTMLHRQAASTV